jgi:type IV pilus assembly protein PilO
MSGLLEKLDTLESRQRWMLFGVIACFLGGIGFYLHSMRIEQIDLLMTAVQELEESVQKHQALAARQDELQRRLVALDDALKLALTLLPETREIPDLLTQISQLGLNAGLEFRLFKPEAEKAMDFYAEVPVTLSILGKFHNVARFFDHLGKLSRIVNVTDIKIILTKGTEDDPVLMTNCLLTTFRFLEPRETDSKPGGKAAGRPAGS